MKFLKIASLLLLAIATRAAFAGEVKPYTQSEFDALTAQGRPVLIEVYADWCSTCQAQRPVLDQLMKQEKYKNVTMMVINFDIDKPSVKHYKVGMQSTLIVFDGKQEQGRSVGATDRSDIETLLGKVVE